MALFGKKKEAVQTATPTKEAQLAVSKAAKADKPAAASMKELYGSPDANKAGIKAVSGKGKVEASTPSKYNQAYRILEKPIITEKGGDLASQGKYVFAVAKDANKIEIAKAILEVYGIMPMKVNVLRMEGKVKQRGKNSGKRKDWKKAIITLPAGKTINVYEGV